jgi:hypothetical protein
MEAAPNECWMCYDDINPGQEYYQCTNPKNDKNPHKVCKPCYARLNEGYDYDEEILDPQALLPSPRLNANGTPMRDARGNPIMMSRDELIAFYKTQKHASHGEGCPMKDGNLVKKTMGQPEQPITLTVMDKAAAAARGGIHDDSDDDLLNQAIQMSLQPLRPSGPGAAVRRLGAAAAAAAAAPEPEDRDLAAAVLASQQETVNPIQQIHRQLNQRGIRVSEEYVRSIFQQMSLENRFEIAIRSTIDYFVNAAARNPPPPPLPFYPPPSYSYEMFQRVLRGVRQRLTELARPVPEAILNDSVQNMLLHERNENRAVESVVQLLTQEPQGGGKKSKIIKSRRGKKSKIIKSRRGKKSKMTKSRRGKKSKMTRKKV